MQIILNQFEQYIDETILKRGLRYFKNGHVLEPEEISPGKYEAIVQGTEVYTVELTIKNGTVIEHICDCPYDMGPVCKHVAAVFFYLQQEELELNKKTTKTKASQTSKPAKRKTIAQQIDELLKKTTHEELKQFVREKAAENASFRSLFLSSFAQHNGDESKEFYIKQLKSILKTASDRDGYIDWSASKRVGKEVDSLLKSAQKQIDNHNYKSAIFICTAVMEQMIEALESAEDSNGDLRGNIDDAYKMLDTVAKMQISEENRKMIIEYCFDSFEKKKFSGWDWHMEILKLAALVLKTEEETKRIFKLIDNIQQSEFEKQKAQTIKYDVLLKTSGENAAEQYLRENITNPSLRRISIEKTFNEKNYERAIFLAQNGVHCDLKNRQGLAKEWYDWLLKIAQAQNNSEKIVEYARFLLIDNFRSEQDYYQILKQHIEPEKWNTFIEAVVMDITNEKQWLNKNLIASIFIKEAWWDRLLALVKKTPELNVIEEYEKYLSKNYANELVELYANGIIEYMKESTSRSHYEYVCRYIRRIIKLGAREKANEIISHLKKEYPKRKALMEELSKV